MIPKIWLVNMVLLAACVYMGIQGYHVWTGMRDMPAETQTEAVKEPPGFSGNLAKSPLQGKAAYEPIPARNLFSPDRQEYIPEAEPEPEAEAEPAVEKEPEPEPEPEPELPKRLKNKLFLHGVVIMDSYKVALMSNPEKKRGEPDSLTVKEGAVVGDLTVTGIQKDRILVSYKDEIYEVNLYDDDKPERKVVETAKEDEPKVVIAGDEAEKKPSADDTPSVAKSASAPQMPKPKAEEKSAEAEQDDEEGEVVYINTPFGKIKRIKKK